MSAYNPTSHFFVDETRLATIQTANYNSDAFGPVVGDLNTKYRTSSFVRAIDENPVKVFAICAGQLFIQPQTGDATKINLILKPSETFSPIKIKYFIYRGVRKIDLLNGLAGSSSYLSIPDSNDTNQPAFLNNLWNKYIAFVTDIIDPTTGEPMPAPIEFLSSTIGYDENELDSVLIDHCFTKKGTTNFLYQIPFCSEGEHIANFTNKMSLDIVLDYGDYEIQNQDQLFNLDLEFARRGDHFFDTSLISTPVRIKRYREHIQQFLDPAAFWGSHIACGTLKTITTTTGTNDNSLIYNQVLSKFQTQNKIYFYIKGEYNRSYNYYETTRQVSFDYQPTPGANTPTLVLHNTHDWPILIKENIVAADGIVRFQYSFENNIHSNIDPSDTHFSFDLIAPNNPTEYFPNKNPNSLPKYFKTNAINSKTISNFLIIHANLKQTFPLKNYFNDLFPVNFSPTIVHPPVSEKQTFWATYNHSRLVNLDDVIGEGVTIQNKLVFDTGNSQSGMPLIRRRLYMAVIKNNTNHDIDKVFDALNISDIKAGIVRETINKEQYILNLYNDSDYKLFKGTFNDGVSINSLALTHNKNILKKNSYFHLGITDEEYNKLVYNNSNVTSPQYLPVDSDNIYFYFEEITSFVNSNIRKFKLGLQYEDNTGTVVTLFPSIASNDVIVYTLDGLYFFSKDYSELQEFYDEFSVNQIHFRPLSNWSGEFGFDWERKGDSGLPGDSLLTSTTPDRSYKNIFGHYYDNLTSDQKRDFVRPIPGVFRNEKKEYISFINKNYFIYPTVNSVYSASYLNIYPSIDSSNNLLPFPVTNSAGNLKCLTEVVLNLMIKISIEPSNLKIVYEKDYFEVSSIIAAETVVSTGTNPQYKYLEVVDKSLTSGATVRDISIKIKCIKEFSENKIIKVVSVENGIEKIAGKTVIPPNAKVFRKTTKIALINCKTNINSFTTYGLNLGATFNYLLEEKITRFFNQCLIDVIAVEHREFDLTPTGVDYPNFNDVYVEPPLSPPVEGGPIGSYIEPEPFEVDQINKKLKDYLFLKYPELTLHQDFLVLFFLNENGYVQASNNPLAGLAEGIGSPNNSVVLFKTGIVNPPGSLIPHFVPAHELFHCLQNQHPFENINVYTSKYGYTDNIMDYLHVTDPIEAISLWQYQKSVAKKHSQIFQE